ncbi:hypothetical protein [Bacillus cereus]|uniref:hypothetical protein n=1 Tax=Bacillus cereus TaxID=1396 RepID=UPI000BF79642|nr:hypothetical protein [Bacillus cereus]PFO46889.1 hypothetical protein COJ71_23875 [Bacillus cereus]
MIIPLIHETGITAPDIQNALFLIKQQQRGYLIKVRALQNLIEKHLIAYGKPLTAHNLKCSFGTRDLAEHKD